MFNQLFHTLSDNSLIITANRRQAAYLRHNYDHWHLQQGHSVWPSLTVIPYSAWIIQYWQQACLMGQLSTQTLLSDFQAQVIWEEIINSSDIDRPLLNTPATAKLIKDAWQDLQHWRVPITHAAFSNTEESRYLQSWIKAYLVLREQQKIIDAAAITEELLALLSTPAAATSLICATSIYFLGFDELNPQQQCLITLLQQQGYKTSVQKTLFNTVNTNGHVFRLGLKDSAAELMTMARWAKNLLDQDSTRRIACVIPNLNEIRPQVERCFNEVFAAHKLLNPHIAPSEHFNISAGKTMAEFPLIHTALLIIKLASQPMLLTSWSTLLRSPFILAAETEMSARAKLEVKLRRYGETTLSLATLLSQAGELCPLLQEALIQIKQLQERTPNKQMPSEWSRYFATKLTLMGWPGERAIDSAEYQLLQRWQQLILEFAALDKFCNAMTLQQAYVHLQRLLASCIFQPQSPQAPVQVLGILEAAGLPFDYLWLMGLSDITWPAPSRPNPFIPISLQRQLNMPHATAERELTIARQLTQHFSQSATSVIFSYPLCVEDRPLRASALINEFTEINIEDLFLPAYQTPVEMIFQHRDSLENLIDEQGPILGVAEKCRGGAAVLQHQAACPFRAFATLRLNAQALDDPSLGLSALERGTLLHRILEKLWLELKDHETLLQQTDTQLITIVNACIQSAIEEKQALRPHTLTPRFIAIEKHRLTKLLLAWLQLEKSRETFAVVATELQQAIVIADLPLQVRIDRIDQLANGDYVIIDYKTGETSIYDWLGERPDAPQLPLYCVSSELNTISGLMFAQINAKKMVMKGLAHESTQHSIPGITSLYDLKEEAPTLEWELLLLQWRQTLQSLAEQFRNGHAKVDPKNIHTTCNECDLQSLCRVYEVIKK